MLGFEMAHLTSPHASCGSPAQPSPAQPSAAFNPNLKTKIFHQFLSFKKKKKKKKNLSLFFLPLVRLFFLKNITVVWKNLGQPYFSLELGCTNEKVEMKHWNMSLWNNEACNAIFFPVFHFGFSFWQIKTATFHQWNQGKYTTNPTFYFKL